MEACDFTRENDPIDEGSSIVTLRKLRKNSRTKIGKLHSTSFSLLNNENFITVLELLFVTLCKDDTGIKS